MPKEKIKEIDESWDNRKINTFMNQDKKRIQKCKEDIKLYESRIAQAEKILLNRKLIKLEGKANTALEMVWDSVVGSGYEGNKLLSEFKKLAAQTQLDKKIIDKFIKSKK